MPGHGSAPDPDRALEPSRQVHRDSGLYKESYTAQVGNQALTHSIQEYRPPPGSAALRSDAGTRFRWSVAPGGDEFHGRVATTRTLKRAQVSVARSGQRYANKLDRFTGK